MRANVEDYVSGQRYDDSGLPFPEEDRRSYNEAKKINDDCTAGDRMAVPAEPSLHTRVSPLIPNSLDNDY
ncbi:hypothetical protein OESDEN_01393 [Oesophagostomum dentatum]|uniref:Uncharacterized protein n=1 Tax=Oesophagostomum dentatum TaxID=61180 RepID=A0A0B1TN09_OESDE|nr:hypothetical protein OESDEN_01393 [Oesophagostomum dentatum]